MAWRSVCEMLFSSPAMANDWPSRSSTSVSARRVWQRRHAEAVELTPLGKSSELTSGLHLQTDDVAGDRRREVQPDAELLVKDRDSASATDSALHDRHGHLAAGEEAGFLAVVGDEVRFGEALQQPPALQRLQQAADVVLRVEEEQVEEVAEGQAASSVEERCRRTAACAVRPTQSL